MKHFTSQKKNEVIFYILDQTTVLCMGIIVNRNWPSFPGEGHFKLSLKRLIKFLSQNQIV